MGVWGHVSLSTVTIRATLVILWTAGLQPLLNQNVTLGVLLPSNSPFGTIGDSAKVDRFNYERAACVVDSVLAVNSLS